MNLAARVLSILVTLGLLALGTAPLPAQAIFIETFDGGVNPDGWTFGACSSVDDTGGNPGWYLHETCLDTFAPQPRPQSPASPFVGNYRARDVSSVGVDLITHAVNSAGDRPLSILLVNDGGTPGDISDDYAAYFVGPDNIPFPGTGWQSYDFAIPSQEMSLPAGWDFVPFGPNANPDWNTVIENVSELRFFYGDPTFFFIFQLWDIGLDNARITEGGLPGVIFDRGDCNVDGAFDIADAVLALDLLFSGSGATPLCSDACDANDDGAFDISDPTYTLNNLFVGGPPPPEPHSICGTDPTDDGLDCGDFSACP